MKRIEYDKYALVIGESEQYINNEARKRSGHMSHAMTHLPSGGFVDFNSNCSAERCYGHSAFGWVEYKISRDNGKSFGESRDLPYSKECFYSGICTISVEKAVTCDSGRVIAFCLRNDVYSPVCCTPWDSPMVVTSDDECENWSEPRELTAYKGRIYDALYHKGSVYVLQFCNEGFLGTTDEHVFRVFKSDDEGESSYESSGVDINGLGRGYGAFVFDENDRLHAYAYNGKEEFLLDHAVSDDFGKTWKAMEPCKLSDGARNPQVAFIDGVFVLHGRACDGKGSPTGFVIYTSLDGQNWEKGYMLGNKPQYCYYSNNIILDDEGGNFLLIQYSDTYTEHAHVNIMHLNVRIERK